MTLILNGTDGLSDVDGSAATPAIRGTDTNTGIFFPAADTIAFSEGGVESMRIDSSGNVGIGTTSPTARLQLSSTGNPGLVFDGTNQAADLKRIRIVTQIAAAGDFAIQSMNDAGTVKSTNLYIDSNGNVGIGTTSPIRKLTVSSAGTVEFVLQDTSQAANSRNWRIFNAGNELYFGTLNDAGTAGNDYLKINSGGNLLINTTAAFDSGKTNISFDSGSNVGITLKQTNANNSGTFLNFAQSGTTIGNITGNATNAAYNTSSDYRLKEDIAPMTGALAKVALLKPCTYKWKINGSDGEGFIAHELAEVCPHAVTGEKDAVDADGNPKYQGIDVSFLVATLTAAIQELKAEFDAYKATHL